MAATLEINLSIKRDGRVLQGFPVSRRIQVDEVQQFSTEQASNNTYTSIPQSEIGTMQVVVLSPTQPITVRFANQSDAGLTLQAGSLLLIIDALVGGSNLLTVNNNSGSTALLEGLSGGT